MSDGADKRYISGVKKLFLNSKHLSFYLSFFLHLIIIIMLLFFYVDHKKKESSLTEIGLLGSNEFPKGGVPASRNQNEEVKKNIIVPSKIVHRKKEEQVSNKIIKQPVKPGSNIDSTGNQTEGNNLSAGNSGSGLSGKGTAGGTGTVNSDYYYVAVDQMPVPVGGMQSVLSRMNIDESGTHTASIYVLAFIDEQGIVKKCLLVKGIGNSTDQLALNIIRKTKFQPGILHGKRVKVQLYISVPVPVR